MKKTPTNHTRLAQPSVIFLRKFVAHVNRKKWWHVPPRDPLAYEKRGMFLASSFSEAEFWGRPLDQPQKVVVKRPLVGDESTIETKLFGHRVSRDDMTMKERLALDAKMKRTALAKGYDSIAILAPRAYSKFREAGKIPRSAELNLLSLETIRKLRDSGL